MTRVFRQTVLTALLLLPFPALAAVHHKTPPAPAAADVQRLTYEVYAGGVNAVAAQLEVGDDAGGRYHATLTAQTRGLLGKLAPWSGTFAAQGWRLKSGQMQPQTYQSTSAWQKKTETKQFSYGRDGSFLGFHVQEQGQDASQKADPQLTQGTTDALSATMAVMNKVAQGGACEGSSDVFDGLRRFHLIFHQQTAETLSPTALNIYSGPAVRCTVEVVPDGGRWHVKPRGWMSIQEQGRLKGSLPTVWLAQLDKGGPAVPVKIRVLTNYGTLFMQLAAYQNGDRHLAVKTAAP